MSEPEIVTVDWEAVPLEIDGLECRVGKAQTEWFITRNKSPYFCFGGPSRDEAIATAKRAMRFWRKTKAWPHDPDQRGGVDEQVRLENSE